MDLYEEIGEDVLGEWQVAAERDTLNEYISSKIPIRYRSKVSYVDDLNALSALEQKIGMVVTVFAPGTLKHSPIGWVSFFVYEGKRYGTAPNMVGESICRAMLLVLFLEFQKTLKTLMVNEV